MDFQFFYGFKRLGWYVLSGLGMMPVVALFLCALTGVRGWLNHMRGNLLSESGFLLFFPARSLLWVIWFVLIPSAILFLRAMRHSPLLFAMGVACAGGIGLFLALMIRRRSPSFCEYGYKFKIQRDRRQSEVHVAGFEKGGRSLPRMIQGLVALLPSLGASLPPGHRLVLISPWMSNGQCPRLKALIRKQIQDALPGAQIEDLSGRLPTIEHFFVRCVYVFDVLRQFLGWAPDSKDVSHHVAFARKYPGLLRSETPSNGFLVTLR